jgi:hypothetical protein
MMPRRVMKFLATVLLCILCPWVVTISATQPWILGTQSGRQTLLTPEGKPSTSDNPLTPKAKP